MIIVAGKTIQEVKDQLNQIEELTAAGYQCSIGGESLAEVREMSNRLALPVQYVPEPEPREDCCCHCHKEPNPCDPDYEYLLDRICQMLRD